MTMDLNPEIAQLSREIILDSVKPYTQEQLAELPLILNAKNRYFWCIDNHERELLADVFTKEGFTTYWNGQPGLTDGGMQAEQNSNVCNDTMVPMHMGHNMIVRFTGEKSAQLLTKLNDCHTYKEDNSVYEGFAIYVDDLIKCDDGVWRIKTLRLTYRVINGQLKY